VREAALLVLAVLLLAHPVAAAPLRVLAASEVRVEPRVSSDRRTLLVTVRVRDDRGAAVQGPVTLEWGPEDLLGPHRENARTDARGEATFILPIQQADRVFALRAEFQGSETAATASQRVRVDLDAPFIILDLRTPPVVDLEDRNVELIASVQVGEVVLESPEGKEVQLVADERPLGTATADATGRVVFRIPVARLGPPGVRELRVDHVRQGVTVSSPTRRVVVRARTTLTLERSTVARDGLTVVGALVTEAGPVANAPVRILSSSRVVGAGLTSANGTYAIAIDPEIASHPGLEARAVFTPSEPWYRHAASPLVQLTPPAAGRVRWTVVSVPVLAALALLLLVRLVRRGTAPARPSAPPRALEDARIELVSDAPSGAVRVRLVVIDRASQAVVRGATAMWKIPAVGAREAGEVVEVPGARFAVEIAADGYAPRALTGDLPRGGEYALRVPLRTWREELFERLRRWLRRAAPLESTTLPTPREALAARAVAHGAEEFVAFVEEGAYGPVPPDAEAIRRAEALASAIDAERRGER
jgi:hypothetical protein